MSNECRKQEPGNNYVLVKTESSFKSDCDGSTYSLESTSCGDLEDTTAPNPNVRSSFEPIIQIDANTYHENTVKEECNDPSHLNTTDKEPAQSQSNTDDLPKYFVSMDDIQNMMTKEGFKESNHEQISTDNYDKRKIAGTAGCKIAGTAGCSSVLARIREDQVSAVKEFDIVVCGRTGINVSMPPQNTSDQQLLQPRVVPENQPPSVTPASEEQLKKFMSLQPNIQLDSTDKLLNAGNQNEQLARDDLADSDGENQQHQECTGKQKLGRGRSFQTYKCKKCSYTSTYPGSVTAHERLHIFKNPHVCNICDFSTFNQALFNVHKYVHTGEHCYKCPLCSYSTSLLTSIAKHAVVDHPGEKVWKCKACKYEAASIYCLNRHERVYHSGEKPWKCQKCDFKAIHKSFLTRHEKLDCIPIRKEDRTTYIISKGAVSGGPRNIAPKVDHNTGDLLFRCDKCYFISYYSSQLMEHSMVNHPC